jgi:hypothetical protein
MGKTNLGSVLMEELARAGLRFSVVDPMGVWWGLRHDKSGKGKGIEVLILGGVHGDIPIEPTAGAVVADLVVDESVNVVIDISRRADGTMWSIGERIRFVTDYAKRLYQRHGERRRPLMQVIDEAARFIPQMLRKGDDQVAHCMGAVAVLVEEGRNVGIGVTLITQRSARLNKDVAELADCMIAFRTVGPNSRRAVMDWLGEHVEKGRLKELDLAVRTVPVGSGLVVSPGWLEIEKIVEFRERETFDSSRTPKAGHVEARVSGEGAKPDLAKYQERMAATIEKAKAEDPKELRRQLAERDREIAKMRNSALSTRKDVPAREKLVEKRVEVSVLKAAQADKLVKFGDRLVVVATDMLAFGKELVAVIRTAKNGRKYSQIIPRHIPPSAQRSGAAAVGRAPVPISPPKTRSENRQTSTEEGLSRTEQRVLDSLTWWEALGFSQPSKFQVGFTAGYRVGKNVGGTFGNILGSLRSNGLIAYPSAGTVSLTDEGRALAQLPDIEPTPEGLQRAVFERLSATERRVLQGIMEAYPEAISKQEAGQRARYTVGENVGGTFGNILGKLRSLGLIDYPSAGQVVAQPLLFLEETRR